MTDEEIDDVLQNAETALKESRFRVVQEYVLPVLTVVDSYESCCNREKTMLCYKANRLMSISLWRSDRFSEALQYSEKQHFYAEKVNDTSLRASAKLNLGINYMFLYSYEEAYTYFINSQELYREIKDDVGVAKTLLMMGDLWRFQCKFNEGLVMYDEAMTICENHDEIELLIKIRFNIAFTYFQQCQYSEALQLLEKLVVQCTNHNLIFDKAHTLMTIGNIYISQSDYVESLSYYTQALLIVQEMQWSSLVAKIFANMGNAFRALDDYKTALTYYQDAYNIIEIQGEPVDKGIVLGNIGILYRHLENYTNAIEYLEKSVQVFESINAKSRIGMFVGNIGITYSMMNNYSRSLEYLHKAIELSKEFGSELETAQFSVHAGNVLIKLYDFSKAEKYLHEGLHTFVKLGRKQETAGVKGYLGTLYSSIKHKNYNTELAERYLLESLTEHEALGTKYGKAFSHRNIADFYKQEHRWNEYIFHIEQYIEVYKSVQTDEVKKYADRYSWERKIMEMKREKEIARIRFEHEKILFEKEISNQQNILRSQAREVEITIHELLKKNDFMHQFHAETVRLQKYVRGEGIDILEHLTDKISRSIKSLETINELDKQWSEVHGLFMRQLKSAYPSLSVMELKIAALLNMKLTSSNISVIMSLSKRTVEFHRLNIRKKMNLTSTDDIYVMFSQISSGQ